MSDHALKDNHFLRAAGVNGLHRHNGCWRRSGEQVDWHIHVAMSGWLTLRRPHTVPAGQDPLSVHADWAGPVKLEKRHGQVESRGEFFVGDLADITVDRDAAARTEDLLTELLRQVLAGPRRQSELGDWQPPEAAAIARWLADDGHEPAIDKDQNLRLTLKRRGVEGAVRIERGPGRLRFTLPLGTWKELDADARSAMRGLVEIANAGSRLTRLAWLADEAGQRCEAQVDLSGLPAVGALSASREPFWRGMAGLAVGALDLVMRQLALELPLLADPRNRLLDQLVRQRGLSEPRTK